ncbi:hypothetical protein BGX31_008706 [Mortierella sp. GBA43]|nr:hypothetical protein BGX31_008706 [Mortierella sp. GBA43]
MNSLKDIVRQATETKRRGQQLIGQLIDSIFASGELCETDRDILRYLCPSVSSKVKSGTVMDDNGEQDEEQELEKEDDTNFDDPSHKGSNHESFYMMLLQYLYSGNPVSSGSMVGKRVQQYIDREIELGLLERCRGRAVIRKTMPYPPAMLLRSVAGELYRELKKHYKNGSLELEKKLQTQKAKGFVLERSEIDDGLPAIENFILLNKCNKEFRKVVPLTGIEQPFVSFGERELGILFWLQDLIKSDYDNEEFVPIQAHLSEWLNDGAPGTLITAMLSDIGRAQPQKGRRDMKDSTSVMELDAMRNHLQHPQHPEFDPRTYNERGYVHRGSIRTDGFRLQMLMFKLRELQSVRFRRLSPDVLPPKVTSAVGGCDFYLTEVRNVVESPQDVADLWQYSPQDIKILGLDLGQACVVGASAILPKGARPRRKRSKRKRGKKRRPRKSRSKKKDPGKNPLNHDTSIDIDMKSTTDDSALVFRNLAVKQKAVYQSTFRFRGWMKEQRIKTLEKVRILSLPSNPACRQFVERSPNSQTT